MSIDVAGRVPEWTMADRLRKAREAAGLEQPELEQIAGISRGTISNAERGKTRPRRPVLIAWALATGVPLQWLETGQAPAEPGPDSRYTARDSNPEPAVLQPARLAAAA